MLLMTVLSWGGAACVPLAVETMGIGVRKLKRG